MSTKTTDESHRPTIEAPSLATGLFIDGQFVESLDGATFATVNPATGRWLADIAEAEPADVDLAVAAATRAAPVWAGLSIDERSRLLRRVAAGLDDHAEELAVVESLDTGKPLSETRTLARGTAEIFEFFADLPRYLHGHTLPSTGNFFSYTSRRPLGVVGAIIPWNFPLPFCGVKAGPALAAGNTVVLKPAEETPLSALLFAAICEEVGLPPGVVNVLPGRGEVTGRAVVQHAGVDAIAFTGSTDVGREIGREAGSRLKRATLELGGKSPFIFFADGDLEAAIRTAFYMFTYNQGQVCSAGSRLLIDAEAEERFVEGLIRYSETVRVGDPLDPDTDIGAVISERQLHRIQSYVESGIADGAQLVIGGASPTVEGHEEGWFYAPTIFRDVSPSMRIAREEIFGPVVSIMTFDTDEEAVALANESSYGLTASLWTRSIDRGHRLAEEIEAGTVFVNTMNDGRTLMTPIAGWKDSGLGVEFGLEGFLEYTRLKTVIVNLGRDTPFFLRNS